jgi:hypothetical protein
MTKPKEATKPEQVKQAPRPEWVLTDIESVAKAVKGMMGTRNLIQERLAQRMGGRNLFSNLFHGKAKDVQVLTLVQAAAAMGFEVVIREPATTASQRRLDALRLEAMRLKANKAAQEARRAEEEAKAELIRAVEDQVLENAAEPAERDPEGRLTRALTEAERAEVDRLLKEYDFSAAS